VPNFAEYDPNDWYDLTQNHGNAIQNKMDPKEDYLFKKVSFGIDSDSRVCLVGPNGAGKSTMLKLMVGENTPCEGNVSLRGGITVGRYQHH
jgi:ATPase subunit of ABC transporter with duplicated ATPase domains